MEQNGHGLSIYVIDVGQGDATLVLGPLTNGKRTSLLIDAGPLDPDAGKIIYDLLQSLNVTNLDHTILTHYDADHMGGFVTTYNSTSLLWDADCNPGTYFPTQSMIDLGDTDKETDSVAEYTACRDALKSTLAQGHMVIGDSQKTNIGHEIDLAGGYKATVVAGNGYVIGAEDQLSPVETDNQKSMAVLVSGPDDFEFLIMGDLEGSPDDLPEDNVELALGKALYDMGVAVSVLRTGHHGSASSSHSDFLALILPEVSVISVGYNSYGHPTCDTLKNLFIFSGLVFQTEAGSPNDSCQEQDSAIVANGTIKFSVKEGMFSILSDSSAWEYNCVVGEGCEER